MRHLTMLTFLFAGIICCNFQARAQQHAARPALGIQAELGLPIGNLSKISSLGLGGQAFVSYPINNQFSLKGEIGYLSFSGKKFSYFCSECGYDYSDTTISSRYGNVHAVPLRLGGMYVFKAPFFIQAQIGLAFMQGGTGFLYTPAIGVDLHALQIAFKYESWVKNGSLSFLSLQIGYQFALKGK